jgi:hypothetical protein
VLAGQANWRFRAVAGTKREKIAGLSKKWRVRAPIHGEFRKPSILEESEHHPEISSKAILCNFFLQLNALDTLPLWSAYPLFCRKAIASSKP